MGLRKKPQKKQGVLASILAMFGGSKKSSGKKKPSGPSKGSKSSSSTTARKGPRRPPAERPPVRQPDPIEAFDEAILDTVGFDLPTEEPAPMDLPPAPVFAPMSAPPPPPPPSDDKQTLFPGGVDDSLDALFDSFETGGAPAPPPPPPPQPQAARPPAAPPAPPRPPVPPSAPPVPPRTTQVVPPAPSAPPQGGQDGLVSIGKLLIDQNTLKRIIDKAEKSGSGMYTTTKVISTSQGQDIDALLGGIDRVEGVSGSLVVGRDGLVIASTLPDGMDRELVGAIASSLFSNSDVQCKKMNLGGLRQGIFETEQGVLIMLSVDVGVLVVLSQDFGNLDLTQVLMAINATAA